MTTEDDVRAKRLQLQDMEEQVAILQVILLLVLLIIITIHYHVIIIIRTFGCCT
jgi:hypothetical protein